ncbi:uncharacterized protein LOC130966842 [Arachis stenosperma]|uniref:uncharacterized protein LOC130966842 n=1 Tax=Arachis stenosperma TaxID=217475 RepID=UPI0025AB8474|nr:uncharacterized protein LOC130966842 [Arachis stenosperma]
MADDHDNDHTSDLEERTPHKKADTTPKDTSQINNKKNSPNEGAMDAFQDRLKQLEKEALRQREVEKDLQREIRRRWELENKLLKLEADVKMKTSRSTPEDSTRKEQDPFTKEIMKTKILKDFKLPNMTLYDGTTDLGNHLSNFRSRMYLTDASYAVRCKAFPTTLTKTTIRWFDNLSPRSISSFDDMAKKFLARFSIQKDNAKHAPSLLEIKQGERETLRNYMERFNKTCMDIQNLPTEAAIMGLINGLRERPFSQSISKKYPTSPNEVQERAAKYINMEENSRLGETSKALHQ